MPRIEGRTAMLSTGLRVTVALQDGSAPKSVGVRDYDEYVEVREILGALHGLWYENQSYWRHEWMRVYRTDTDYAAKLAAIEEAKHQPFVF